MEVALRKELGTATLRSFGQAGGGCINNGSSFETDSGQVFVKYNEQGEAMRMFIGEEASLQAICNSSTIRVPNPVKLFEHPSGTGGVFVMEHLDMSSCSSMQQQLGEDVGRLHRHNIDLLATRAAEGSRVTTAASTWEAPADEELAGVVEPVTQFGFECVTCCGFLPQDNTWSASWPEFYARCRLQVQMDMIEKNCGDREALQLWSRLQLQVDKFFAGIDVKPSLIHGDLWSGNIGQTSTCPVVFDPASCYGHHEFDLSIGVMFGGFSPAFHSAYHRLVPKSSGFDKRTDLYLLFHYLNHWNHFGSGYRGKSIALLKSLSK